MLRAYSSVLRAPSPWFSILTAKVALSVPSLIRLFKFAPFLVEAKSRCPCLAPPHEDMVLDDSDMSSCASSSPPGHYIHYTVLFLTFWLTRFFFSLHHLPCASSPRPTIYRTLLLLASPSTVRFFFSPSSYGGHVSRT